MSWQKKNTFYPLFCEVIWSCTSWKQRVYPPWIWTNLYLQWKGWSETWRILTCPDISASRWCAALRSSKTGDKTVLGGISTFGFLFATAPSSWLSGFMTATFAAALSLDQRPSQLLTWTNNSLLKDGFICGAGTVLLERFICESNMYLTTRLIST